MIAATFATATLNTGTLIAAELSHHLDVPMQRALGDVIGGTLSPVQFAPDYAEGRLGAYGPDTEVPGYVRLNRTQFAFQTAQLFGRRLGADQSLLAIDVAWSHVHDFPGKGERPLNAPGGGDRDSWGYRVLARLDYSNVLGAVNLAPRFGFIHDVQGYTPVPFATFWEGRKALVLGVGADYINRWTLDLSYTAFFGGGDDYPLQDRDHIRLNISYWL
jgi:hypothetical protein